MRRKVKDYAVNVDMKWSTDIHVRAHTASEARKKAWARFSKHPARKLFEPLADIAY